MAISWHRERSVGGGQRSDGEGFVMFHAAWNAPAQRC